MASQENMKTSEFVDLASERVGGQIIEVTDEFFAPADNMLKPGRGVFIEDKYTENGKWMDGWESRRKRVEGYDFCIVKLGLRGVVKEVDIDTNHFLGNHPPHASLDACETYEDLKNGNWTEIIKKSDLERGSQNLFKVSSDKCYQFVRLNIFPDGGVARLRVYGDVTPDFSVYESGRELDLVAVENGGKVLFCNDMFFGPKDNLILPGRGINMGDGWETKRRRTPGNDWVILQCGHEGVAERIEIDTHFFKGNFPDQVLVEGINASGASKDQLESSAEWKPLFVKSKLSANQIHNFQVEGEMKGKPLTHIRMQIFPDGGISRLRVWGKLS
jgi:allantoicase